MAVDSSTVTNPLEDYQAILNREPTIHELIRLERLTYKPRPLAIAKYRAYAEGDHALVLSDKQKRMLKHILSRDGQDEFSDNVCGQIIFEARGRLKFSGWDCENKDVSQWLRDRYIDCNLMDFQIDAHNSTLIDGDHCLAVNFDPGPKKIKIYQEPWWDGRSGIFISYDALRQPLFAVKDWFDAIRNIWRRIIWFPDHLERYAARDRNFGDAQMINLPSDPYQEGQPVPWLDKDGSPLGIPYIHLANGFKPKGPYGLSELYGGVIGIQNQINATHWDMTGGGQMTAYQMYTATGVRFKDDKGRNIQPEVGPGNFLHSPSDKARFGHLPAGDLSQLINQLHEKRSTAATVTATPPFRLLGKEWPSAEAIMRSEQPSVEKARTQIAKLIVAYSSLGYKMVKYWNRFKPFNSPDLPADIAVSAILAKFEDPERRDQLSKSVIANNLGDDVPPQEKWRIMGYSDEKVKQLYAELLQAKKDGLVADKNKPQAGQNPFGSQKKPQEKKIQQQQKPINGGGNK